MKQVVFNVGAGLSTYVEVGDYKIIIDLGSSPEFNPVTDFLLPLYKSRNAAKHDDGKRYLVDQCIISHPHRDHLSAVSEFSEYFMPKLITCPNDNQGMPCDEKINWGKIGNESEQWMVDFRQLLSGRKPPLRSICDDLVHLFWLKASHVEEDSALSNESYPNNLSIVTAIAFNGYSVLLPGDLQKEGMHTILKGDCNHQGRYWDDDLVSLNEILRNGIDVLVAPHHGLQSSFSTELFDQMARRKTRCLNIVSEKQNTDDNRNVDSRYSSTDYCEGINSLTVANGSTACQVRTSRGHVLIDYANPCVPDVSVISDSSELLSRFLK